MNIKERLEAEHSKTLTIAIVKYVGADKKRFKQLMDVFFNGDYRTTQRAAWPLSFIAIEQPKLLQPYFDRLIDKLKEPGNHPAISRNIFRILQEIDIPEKYWGVLIDLCFTVIMSETQPAAIRAFALTVATKIAQPFPELRSELLIILKELDSMPQLPSMKSRVKRALKVLKIV
jgi:hypothetical protein